MKLWRSISFIALMLPALSWAEPTLWEDDWRARIAIDSECRASGLMAYSPGLSFERVGTNVYPFGDAWLYEMSCMLFAYQGSLQYIVVDPQAGRAQSLRFALPYYDEQGQVQTDVQTQVTGIVDYDPQTQVVQAFVKGRGFGDCGSIHRYRIHQDASTELLSWQHQPCLDDSTKHKPTDQWPVQEVPSKLRRAVYNGR